MFAVPVYGVRFIIFSILILGGIYCTMDSNVLHLNGIVDECISDAICKFVPQNKAKDKSSENSAFITIGMFRDMTKFVFGKYNNEIINMMKTIKNEAQDERKLLKQEMDKKDENHTKQINYALDLIDNVGQYTRRDNIKIMGIPKTDDENLPQIFTDVVKHNGVDMKTEYISTIHRLNTKDDKIDLKETNSRGTNKKIPSMIARLTHRDIKNEIFASRKQIKEKTGAPYPDAFIVEDVTPLRSRILYSLKNKLDKDGNKIF